MRKIMFLMLVVGLMTVLSCATTQKEVTDEMVLSERGISAVSISDEIGFVEALNSLGATLSSDVLVEPSVLTVNEAIAHTVEAADMTELAFTFKQEKISKILEWYDVDSTGDKTADQLAAAALTVDLIDSDWYQKNLEDQEIDTDDMDYLLKAVVNLSGIGIDNLRGLTTDYLGNVDDKDIYAKVLDSNDNYFIVQNNSLVDVVDEGVIEGITTGYNVVLSKDNCVFDPKLTINYGHGDIKHAIQLIALLKSEGLEAKVDFQGKTSAFVYLKEWGEPEEDYSFKVKEIPSGNYIAYCKEYNLYFEFKTSEDKKRFNDVILAYAKKDEENEPGLIYASWWQPLYSSQTEMGDGYRIITDNVITLGDYQAHPFSLNEDVDTVVEGFLAIDDTLNIDSREFWVNKAFFNYIGGEDFK